MRHKPVFLIIVRDRWRCIFDDGRHTPRGLPPGRPRSRLRPRHRETLAILNEVMSQVTVYTTEPCSFCARVKGLLKSKGVEFAEINLSKDPEGRVQLAQRTGMMTFPQVIVDGELLGGFSEVQAAAESGRLDQLLAA